MLPLENFSNSELKFCPPAPPTQLTTSAFQDVCTSYNCGAWRRRKSENIGAQWEFRCCGIQALISEAAPLSSQRLNGSQRSHSELTSEPGRSAPWPPITLGTEASAVLRSTGYFFHSLVSSMSLNLDFCSFVHLSVHAFIYSFIHLFIHSSMHLPIHLPIHQSITHLPTHPSIHPFIYSFGLNGPS